MRAAISVRPIARTDYGQWLPLWKGYNAFYGRHGDTALTEAITQATWEMFHHPDEPVYAHVALDGELIVGLVHHVFHRSTTRMHDVCYLQDLFVTPSHRGRQIGRQLIEVVFACAREAGSSRVYWQTQMDNTSGRALYDKVALHSGSIVYAHEL